MLKGVRVLLGVTGGIAAYKAAELCRLLIKEGAEVRVVMTEASTKFVSPLTFETLSGHPVRVRLFPGNGGQMDHISWADWAQVMVVAPATANIIGKMANGIADDLLSTMILALNAPIVICPAMNVNMYENPAVQSNLDLLKKRGLRVMEPESGELACGWEGRGRLPDPTDILEEIKCALSPQDLSNEHVLVSAGPTREPIDPVRFISNHSSGKMGYALAAVARRRGAEVTLISGPTNLRKPRGVHFVGVETAAQMHKAVMNSVQRATVVIMAAAVCDFKPKEARMRKIKKEKVPLTIPLEKTQDILMDVSKEKGDRLVVGFAAETEELIRNASEKLKRKNLDFIVANDITVPGGGFGSDENKVTILHKDGSEERFPLMSKEEVASVILDRVVEWRKRGD
jgi:phosphopantothenoylcysteine decarboxylase/phosphopantothenate--cysteine ligase